MVPVNGCLYGCPTGRRGCGSLRDQIRIKIERNVKIMGRDGQERHEENEMEIN